MLQNAYLLAKIGADIVENEQHFAEILPKTRSMPRPGRVGRRGSPRDPRDGRVDRRHRHRGQKQALRRQGSANKHSAVVPLCF